LKSANGPIEVYLCPDNIDQEAAITQPVTCTTDAVLPSDPPSSSVNVEKQEGTLLCNNGPQLGVCRKPKFCLDSDIINPNRLKI